MSHHPIPDAALPATRIAQALAKIGLAIRHPTWRQAWPLGLTPTQGQILASLIRRPAGMRLGAIADELAVAAPTASDAVAALVSKALVDKRPASDDGRAVIISLTHAGRELAHRARQWPELLGEAIATLEPGEQAVVLRSFVKMIRALQESGQIPVMRMCVTCRFFRPHAHADPLRPHHCAFVDAPFGDARPAVGLPGPGRGRRQRIGPAVEAVHRWRCEVITDQSAVIRECRSAIAQHCSRPPPAPTDN